MEAGEVLVRWPEEGVARVPFQVFSDREIYEREQQRIFRGPVWQFLCIEQDIPQPGDVVTSWMGETPVIVARDHDGAIHAMVNRCAHKGALVALKSRDSVKHLTCVYHAWSYRLDGSLRSIAFQKGVNGKGGMPEDFDVSAHRLQPVRVQTFCGLVFGTLSDETPPLGEFLGPRMSAFIERNYGGIVLSDRKWHHISYSKRATFNLDKEYLTAEVHSAKYGAKHGDSALEGPELLDAWEEFDDGITHSIQTVFPNVVFQFTLNSLAIRFFVPKGVDKTELMWIFLGYERDTPEQSAMRIMQSNLTGAAGLVALEDGCINEFVQRGTVGGNPQGIFAGRHAVGRAAGAGRRRVRAADDALRHARPACLRGAGPVRRGARRRPLDLPGPAARPLDRTADRRAAPALAGQAQQAHRARPRHQRGNRQDPPGRDLPRARRAQPDRGGGGGPGAGGVVGGSGQAPGHLSYHRMDDRAHAARFARPPCSQSPATVRACCFGFERLA